MASSHRSALVKPHSHFLMMVSIRMINNDPKPFPSAKVTQTHTHTHAHAQPHTSWLYSGSLSLSCLPSHQRTTAPFRSVKVRLLYCLFRHIFVYCSVVFVKNSLPNVHSQTWFHFRSLHTTSSFYKTLPCMLCRAAQLAFEMALVCLPKMRLT